MSASSSISDTKAIALLDFIAIGHMMSGTVAFTLIYYPFIALFDIPRAVMVGWAFFTALIANRFYFGLESSILKHLNLDVKRDGKAATIFLMVLTIIGALMGYAVSYFWITLIVIAVEACGYYLLYTIIRQQQQVPPVKRKINVKRLARQYAKIQA